MAIIEGNKDSNVGVVILWTNIDVAKKNIDSENYFLMSNLFSSEEGISSLIRGLLKYKNVRHLIVCGVDMQKSGEALVKLFEQGVEDHKIIGTDILIDKEISLEQIENIINNVELHDLCDNKLEKINNYISSLSKLPAWGESESVNEHIISTDKFSNEEFGFEVFDNNIKSAESKLLKLLIKFGVRNKDLLELYGIRCVLENCEIGSEHLDELNIDDVVNELKETGIVFIDVNEENLVDLVCVMNQSKLNLIARYAKLDLTNFESEILKLRKTQEEISNKIGLSMGNTVIDLISVCNNSNLEIGRNSRISDPRGNIIIEVRDGEIFVKHLSVKGERLEEFYAKTAKECINWLVNECKVKLLIHAFDLGRELEKAELALKNNLKYEQDKELLIE